MPVRKTILEPLIKSTGGLHLTAYLERNEAVELQNTIQHAYEYLAPVLDSEKRNKFLEPLDRLLKSLTTYPRRLDHITGNVGIFRTEDLFQVINLPVAVQTSCFIADSFHVKPLLRWCQEDQDFLLLGVTPQSVHLFSGNQRSFHQIDSFHCLNLEADQVELAAWLQGYLRSRKDRQTFRVFVAGQEELTGVVRTTISHLNCSTTHIAALFSEPLANQTCAQVREFLKTESLQTAERFLRDFADESDGLRIRKNIFEISRAATQGRVTKLVVCDNLNIFGKIDPGSGGLSLHPFDQDHEDDDILDDLAQIVLSRGGEVLVAPSEKIPNARPVLALVDEGRRILRPSTAKLTLSEQYEALQERYG